MQGYGTIENLQPCTFKANIPVHSNSEQRICTPKSKKTELRPVPQNRRGVIFIKEETKFKIRLNQEEKQIIENLAKESKLTQQEVLRRIALEKPICAAPDKSFFDILNELYQLHDDFKTLSQLDESSEKEVKEVEVLIVKLQEKYQLGGEGFGSNKPMAYQWQAEKCD